MTKTYPIVAAKNLAEAPARGLWRRRVRDESELLPARAHEVLVYRVQGRFVVDHDQRRASDDDVAAASHVSVVDVSVDAPVLVELKVRSADATDFTVHVTFRCTVTDAVLVVRNGLTDATGFLLEYLRGMPDIFQIGQDFRLQELDRVQRALSAFVTSSVVHDPPLLPGIRIRMAGVQVLTPAEVETFEHRRRELSRDHVLADDQQSHEHRYAERALRHDLDLNTERLEARLAMMRRLAQEQVADPETALLYGMATGELSSVEAGAILRDRAERREAAAQETARRRAALHFELLRDLVNSSAGEFANIDRDKLDLFLDKLIDEATEAVDRATEAPRLTAGETRRLPGEARGAE
ncbi:hypothetical protein [Nocardia farcinica]|uniref:hypothetical protein n=1 Tax=Nocardia farcinica TaxID=37329 RepID=UPI0018962844|nr:hypothetical protein [Nocardia farcinica]MBF6442556.1 hypothetical protein [Nocardia farcinica]MBF6522941.1 hypothetical protein [Nocardia farcinica]